MKVNYATPSEDIKLRLTLSGIFHRNKENSFHLRVFGHKVLTARHGNFVFIS